MPALQAGGERFESAGVHFICYQKSMNNLPLNIKVIIGSVREGRFADKAATWIAGELAKESDVTVEVLDLNDYQMPFFNAPVSPSYKTEPYTHEAVARFTAKVAEGDAFVLVTPEYNHGTSGVLKNALDWVYSEWNHKAVGFVSYGSVGGARAVEQLTPRCHRTTNGFYPQRCPLQRRAIFPSSLWSNSSRRALRHYRRQSRSSYDQGATLVGKSSQVRSD
jgi:NAD(P)H-dependent FMN reductase